MDAFSSSTVQPAATSRRFARLNVGHEKIKDRPVRLALFYVQTKAARIKAYERCALLGDWQAEIGTVKFRCFGPGIGSDNDVT